MLRKPDSALIVLGHGSTVNPDSGAPTRAHAETLRERNLFGEVQAAFWKEEPKVRQVLHSLESADVYLVPNFISEGYFTGQAIPRALQLSGPLTRQVVRRGEETRTQTVRYCEPVGNHPRMTGVLLRRARETAPNVPPERTCLIVVGHGTELNDNSALAVKRQVQRIGGLGAFAEVQPAYMEEPPFVADWRTLTAQPNVIVVPFFIADGMHSTRDIPALLGLAPDAGEAGSQACYRNPHRLSDRELYYARAVGTEPLMADVILDQVAAFDEAFPPGAGGTLPHP